MEQIIGNILDVNRGIIVHGCNAQGKMFSGVAKQIREKWPQVFTDYNRLFRGFVENEKLLGKVVFTQVDKELYIASGITQYNYGNDGKKYVSYDALDTVFNTVGSVARAQSLDVYFPMIGAGLGGGDWSVIKAIIDHQLEVIFGVRSTVVIRGEDLE